MSAVSRSFDDPAAEAAKLLNRLGLAVLVIVTPCAGLFSIQALYSLMPVGAVLILIAAVLRGDNGVARLLQALRSPLGALALFIAFWSCLSLAWTVFPLPAGERFFKTFGLGLLVALAASCLPDRTKVSNLNLIPIGLFATVLATLILILVGVANFKGGSDIETSLLQRSVITLVLLIWPALGVLSLRERWMTAGALAILVAVAVIGAWARISLMAMAIGALTFAGAMSQPVWTARVAAVVFAALFAAAPVWAFLTRFLVNATGFAESLASPMIVWADLMANEWPRVITGHGLVMAAGGVTMGYLPAETPTSLMFEIWYDLGIVGAWAFAALILFAFSAAGRTPANVAPALIAGLVAGLTIAVFGLATEQIWWVTLVAVDTLAFACLVKGSHRGKRLLAQTVEAEQIEHIS
ncbi:hypothetical protein [Methyloferula stellata]|uniref:hypothetical protein n=1 Tax=Methyloferula stellata TaxID=876270 RepID=UPI00037A2505|nr:hypothetical protein [Methyloferula stellata]